MRSRYSGAMREGGLRAHGLQRHVDRVYQRLRGEAARERRRVVERSVHSLSFAGLESVLVEVGIRVPDMLERNRMTLGVDPRDLRVTCLANLREDNALPPASFDVIVLANTLFAQEQLVVVENVFSALRPEGTLHAAAPRSSVPLLADRFEDVTSRRGGLCQIVRGASPDAMCDERVIVLMYHRIAHEGSDPHSLQVRPEFFERHLQELRRTVNVVPLAAATRPSASPCVAIMFDDGYRDNLVQALPLMRQYEIPATVFVTSGMLDNKTGFWIDRLANLILEGPLPRDHLRVEIAGTPLLIDVSSQRAVQRAHAFLHSRIRVLPPDDVEASLAVLAGVIGREPDLPATALPLTTAELRELAVGDQIEIGAHTVSHAMLSSLDAAEQRQEMEQSKLALEDLLACRVPSFAYPFGDSVAFNDTSVRIAREFFDLAVMAQSQDATRVRDRYRIPRHYVGDWDIGEFSRRLRAWLV